MIISEGKTNFLIIAVVAAGLTIQMSLFGVLQGFNNKFLQFRENNDVVSSSSPSIPTPSSNYSLNNEQSLQSLPVGVNTSMQENPDPALPSSSAQEEPKPASEPAEQPQAKPLLQGPAPVVSRIEPPPPPKADSQNPKKPKKNLIQKIVL